MSTNFDQVITQTHSVNDVQQRATLVLQSISDQLATAGEDKNQRTEFANALKSNQAKLAQAIAGP